MALSDRFKRIASFGMWKPKAVVAQPDGKAVSRETTEIGRIATPENSTRYLYEQLWVNPETRAAILQIRYMDKADGRVKRIHKRMARDAVKGGLRLEWERDANPKVQLLWSQFVTRLKLDERSKLESDARGAVMEGALALQRVVDTSRHVSGLVRMPIETIVPQVDVNGRFKDPALAYVQIDNLGGNVLAEFALWQLGVVRLDPDNFDDVGSMGRPYLDANRTVWQKLTMTEEDMVVRRRTRAPLRMSHSLEGASSDELNEYEQKIYQDQNEITTDFFSNRKLTVQAVQGDSNLDQIADVNYLLDTFFAGAPAPKGLFGYVQDLARDVLEDLKKDYYEEIDCLQDVISQAYHEAFELELLLQGLNPERYPFTIKFAERRTESRNQRADLALKYQAIGASDQTIFEVSGLDPEKEKSRLKKTIVDRDPYPAGGMGGGSPRVSVTPNNAPKGESATSISNGGK